MFFYRRLQKSQIIVICLGLLSGCAVHADTNGTKGTSIAGDAESVIDSAGSASTPTPEPVEKTDEKTDEKAVCPTEDDLHRLIAEMKKLQANAHLFLAQIKEPSTENGNQSDQLEGLKKRIDDWKTRETSACNNCYLLTNAHGTEVNSEIPRALEALSHSEEYLMKSIEAHELKNYDKAKIFFAFAKSNLKHAEKISHK